MSQKEVIEHFPFLEPSIKLAVEKGFKLVFEFSTNYLSVRFYNSNGKTSRIPDFVIDLHVNNPLSFLGIIISNKQSCKVLYSPNRYGLQIEELLGGFEHQCIGSFTISEVNGVKVADENFSKLSLYIEEQISKTLEYIELRKDTRNVKKILAIRHYHFMTYEHPRICMRYSSDDLIERHRNFIRCL
jgi:hypothetical protein